MTEPPADRPMRPTEYLAPAIAVLLALAVGIGVVAYALQRGGERARRQPPEPATRAPLPGNGTR